VIASRFEFFVASRYLRARRKEAVISLITLISVIGVAAGVMALVVALAVTNGFHNTLERSLLGAMAHINVEERNPQYGIENWRDLAARLRKVPHVVAVAPALYTPIFLQGPVQSKGALLKGVDIDSELAIGGTLRHLKAGSLDRLRNPDAKPPGILLGSRLAEDTGMVVNSRVRVVSPEGKLTIFGPLPSFPTFYVSGTFHTDFYDVDDGWAYTSIAAAQHALSLEDVVNTIEVNVDDVNRAPEVAQAIDKIVAPRYKATPWTEQNKQIFSALRMERVVTMIVIGLILLVAALNILITLVMMVMEKYRDIAILMSMGARQQQIRRIFMTQGVLIGAVGSAIGLALGYTFCHFAEKYRLIPLQESVYSMSFVPFESRWTDGIWIAAVAILVSFLATLYPARNATRIAPAEVLRYE
jgi:lipoprotein-releasing system permease protein